MIRVSYWINDEKCLETWVKEDLLSVFIAVLLTQGYTIHTIGDQ